MTLSTDRYVSLYHSIQDLPFLSTCMILPGFDIGFYDLFGQVASIPADAIGSGSGGVYHNDTLRIPFPFGVRPFI